MADERIGVGRLPVTRSEAVAVGAKRYFTSKPCSQGHVAARFTSNCGCVECQLSKVQKWRNENRHKVREYNQQVYWADPKWHRVRAKKHRLTNAEIVAATQKRWRRANMEKCREYARRKNLRAPEKNRARVKRWREENPEKAAAMMRNVRAQRRGADGFHTIADIERIRKAQRGRCAVCRCRINGGGHVDHIQALRRGGSNWPSNIQILCPPCNHHKNSRDPMEFMQSRGLLL